MGTQTEFDAAITDFSRLIPVVILDASGNQIVSFGGGGGTQYAEDAAHVSGNTGTLALTVRQDSPANLSGTDGDYEALQVSGGLLWARVRGLQTPNGDSVIDDTNDAVKVSLVNSALNSVDSNNSSAVALAGGATFTGTATEVLQKGCISVQVGVDQDGTLNADFSNDGTNWDRVETYTINVATGGVTEGFSFQLMAQARYYRIRYVNGASAQGVFRLQAIPKMIPGTSEVHAANTALTATTDCLTTKGVIYGVTTGGGGGYVAVKVTPSGALTAAVTVAAQADSIAKAEDVASADADVGVPAMAVRKATPANTSGTDGDYEMLQMSAGRLWASVVVDTALPAGTNNIGDVDILSIAAGDNNIGNVDVVTLPSIPAGTNNIGDVDVLTLPAIPSGTNAIGSVNRTVASSATLANVAGSASSVTLFSANANRRGGIIFNDSTAILYVKFGATASTTSFSYKLLAGATLEFPEPMYVGVVDGIWASATGSARNTEIA